VRCLLPELPLTDLREDVAAVHTVLDRCDGPVTLLGHSYGGSVITVAGLHPAVERLVYLCALGPDAGEHASGGPVEVGHAFIEALRPSDDGRTFVDPALAARLFYPDLDDATADRLAERLRPGNTGGAVLVERAAWRERPASYVVCSEDPIVLPGSQRAIAARMGATVLEMPGDHSPMVARPIELADLLCDVMA
jgi:pimeloyl-ACP methyl ester carboxylesterase